MVQSKAETVDAFLEQVGPERRAALTRLRALCRDRGAWVEAMRWGMPGYGPPGRDPLVAFNSQKQYIALYAGEVAVERFRDRLAGLNCGKGCIRYRQPDQMDFALIAEMLDDIATRDTMR